MIWYTVKSGDSLSKIANTYGYTTDELAAYNGIANPNRIQVGQTIKFPPKGNTAAWIPKIGDTVLFEGTDHYKAANGTAAAKCKPGKAKITNISKNSKHPYHLKWVAGGGSTVYGWVDAENIKKA